MIHPTQLRAFIRYGSTATPWGLVTITGAVIVALLVLVSRWPDVVWPLHGSAIGLIAGVSAWSIDERCASVVDVTPRPMWWRTIARTPTSLLLVGAWTATHLAVRDRLPDHLGVLVLQGASAATCGFAIATWHRTRGRSEPGQRIAVFVCPVAVALALVRPWNNHAPHSRSGLTRTGHAPQRFGSRASCSPSSCWLPRYATMPPSGADPEESTCRT